MKQLSLLILLLSFATLHAGDFQQFYLKNDKLHGFNGAPIQLENIDLFVKGNTALIEEWVTSNDGIFKYAYGEIASVTIPAEKEKALHGQSFVKRIENGHRPMVQLMDTSMIIHHIAEVHDGVAPLDQPYTGEGIVMGIIDAGIYFDHSDFKNPDGTTRIKYMWDQNATTTNPPAPYNYGRQWTETDFNLGNVTHSEPSNRFGHGTHVAGAAAGNGNAVGDFTGVAPEADLIIVAYDYSDPGLSKFVDAVHYVFKLADAMGKPAVVNASLGTYYGSRDATDLAAKMIEQLLMERSGRTLVAAAGNAGNRRYHLGYEASADTSFTWFRFTSTFNIVYFEMYADTAELYDFWFSLGADAVDSTGFTSKVKSEYFNIHQQFSALSPNQDVNVSRALSNTDGFIGIVSITAKHLGDKVKFEIEINPTNNNDYWRLSTTGSGRFDIWSSQQLMGHSNIVHLDDLPPAVAGTVSQHYQSPDNLMTLVSSFTCSDKVITVANAENRYGHINVDSALSVVNENPVGAIHHTSSRGPTRDNRVKPNITATGTRTMATGNISNVNALIGSGQGHRVAPGAKHSTNGGTSLAAPKVAGAAVLYLQKNPNAWYFEVKDAIEMSAFQDDFTTTDVPNHTYGWGKLSVFQAMQKDLVYGCTDPDAINFNEDANMDDNSCIEAVLGCTDENATNFNPEANVDDGSCKYDTTYISEVVIYGEEIGMTVYPNPFTQIIQVEFDKPIDSRIELKLYDLTGRVVAEKTFRPYQDRFTLNTSASIPGLYILGIYADGERVAKKKLIQK